MIGKLTIVVLAIPGIAVAGSSDNCEEQSCSAWGGTASKSLLACYVSGTGSNNDKLYLEDVEGNDFYRCERPAEGECRPLTCEEIGDDCLGCVDRPDCVFCRSVGGAAGCRTGDESGPTDGTTCPGNWPEDIDDGGWIRDYDNCPV